MVHINKTKQFDVYDLDTQQSSINRLAAELTTLPKYLYFPDGIPTITQFQNKNGNIYVEDLLEFIRNNSGIVFGKVFEKVENKLTQQNLNILNDIFEPFVALNKTLSVAKNDEPFYVLAIQNELEYNIKNLDKYKIFPDKNIEVEKILKNKKEIVNKITDAIKSNKTTVENQTIVFLNLKNTVGIPYTSFELESINFDFSLEMMVPVTIEQNLKAERRKKKAT